MTGLGNDIIALSTIDIARTRDQRFYSKILSLSEQQLYTSQFPTLPLEHFVWLLWSIKESAYKCLQRHHPDLVFSPVKMEVSSVTVPLKAISLNTIGHESTGFDDAACFCSEIRSGTYTLYARSIIYADELIVTAVQDNDNFDSLNWGLKQIAENDPESQSKEVRVFLVKRLASLFPGTALTIEMNNSGCPLLIVDEKASDKLISLSHHGRYVAYAVIV